jgi:endonuclease/exonuclease/phosphatase family metal-dependent hydrolase
MRLRVLTLNTWNTNGAPKRLAVINRELRQPDLVSLQEVMRTEDRDQLAELLSGTGLQGTHQRDVRWASLRASATAAVAAP